MVIYFFSYFYQVSLSKRFFEPRSSHFTFGSGCTVPCTLRWHRRACTSFPLLLIISTLQNTDTETNFNDTGGFVWSECGALSLASFTWWSHKNANDCRKLCLAHIVTGWWKKILSTQIQMFGIKLYVYAKNHCFFFWSSRFPKKVCKSPWEDLQKEIALGEQRMKYSVNENNKNSTGKKAGVWSMLDSGGGWG